MNGGGIAVELEVIQHDTTRQQRGSRLAIFLLAISLPDGFAAVSNIAYVGP